MTATGGDAAPGPIPEPPRPGRPVSSPVDWALDPSIAYLNHGSFGACLREVMEAQRAWRERLESNPTRFLARELEGLLDEARSVLAGFVGADPDDIALLPNATAGINTVLRSLDLGPGDDIVATDHSYNATLNALRFTAERTGARLNLARLPFPIGGPDEAFDTIMDAVGPRTRLVLVDHVTSPTALVLPIERMVRELGARGIDVFVDGAHGPGMVPLDLGSLAPAFYTATTHKWICGPKGTGFLFVRRDRQPAIRPLAISHGANDPRTDRSRFRLEFDWTGTFDPTGYLTVPTAIRAMSSLLPGGWPALMAANRQLALSGRDLLCDALDVPPPAPNSMIGSMAAVPLPLGPWPRRETLLRQARLEAALRAAGIEAPLMTWPPVRPVTGHASDGDERSGLLVRVSAQVYNHLAQYERLAERLMAALAAD
jgi:isopenicillin-N epimerase